MGKKTSDKGAKNKKRWVFNTAVLSDLETFCRGDASAYAVLETNPNTGKKILKGDAVRKDVAKDAAIALVDFLASHRKGAAINKARYHEADLSVAIAKYDGKKWSDLVQEEGAPEVAPAEPPVSASKAAAKRKAAATEGTPDTTPKPKRRTAVKRPPASDITIEGEGAQ